MPPVGAPDELLRFLESKRGIWSRHAAQGRVRLDLHWSDIIQILRSAERWKRERDEQDQAIDGFKDVFVGRDTRGRRLYPAGKAVYYKGERTWYVITVHKAT